MRHATRLPDIDLPPYRLSGVVYGTLLNHAPALAALGSAVHEAPYKGPPKAPVLFIKPRNTLAASGDAIAIPKSPNEVVVGASLGVVIGRTACHLQAENALDHVAGFTIVGDLSLPHDVFYRPSIRFIARDGFCPIGPTVVSQATIKDPDALKIQVYVNGTLMQETTTGERLRSVVQLLADVTEFMTLHPGDILTTGVSFGAPRARAGDSSRIVIQGIGELINHFKAEGDPA